MCFLIPTKTSKHVVAVCLKCLCQALVLYQRQLHLVEDELEALACRHHNTSRQIDLEVNA